MGWTDSEVLRAIDVLKQCRSLQEATPLLPVPYNTLRRLMNEKNLGTPASYLKGGQRDPVTSYKSKFSQKKEKRDYDLLLKRLAEAEARVEFVEQARRFVHNPPRVVAKEAASGLREGVAVALLSDVHAEEVVLSEKVAGVNEYNLEISKARMERYFDGVEWLVNFNRHEWAIRDLILAPIGDLMTGNIHEELVETNDASPAETVLVLLSRMTAGIDQLLKIADLEITVAWGYGNHGRYTEKRRLKTGAENSFEWMLGKMLEKFYEKEPRVRFEVPPSAHTYVQVYDSFLHFTHGDELKFGGGIGGLAIPLGKRVPVWNNIKRSAVHHIGHFHTLQDFGHTVANGSLIGYSEYSMANGFSPEPPQQAFYVFDKKRGKTAVHPIWVD